MANKDFQKFLSTVKAPADDSKQKARMCSWQEHVQALYQSISELLNEYVSTKELQLTREPKQLFEELLGSYPIEALVISIGDRRIVFEPIGTYVIGAYGRVDMKGPMGFRRLVLVHANASSPKIKISIVSDNEKTWTQEQDETPQLAWRFATSAPNIQYIDLDADSLTSSIMELLGG